MNNEAKFKRLDSRYAAGTSYYGEIKADYETLKALLGKPQEFTEGKIRAEWVIQIKDRIITIYDYKEKEPLEKVEYWHIGGKAYECFELFYDLYHSFIKDLPVWIFTDEDNNVVEYSGTREQAINQFLKNFGITIKEKEKK